MSRPLAPTNQSDVVSEKSAPLRLRFLLDTNVLIPLQDSMLVLEANLATFIRMANEAGHHLFYHPATIKDFQRDLDIERRKRNLNRLAVYSELEGVQACPWNEATTSENDACDNEILYAVACDAVHALVTEDKRLHAKARARGLADRVYYIQTAEDWLNRLRAPREVRLPNIRTEPLHALTPILEGGFFDSLRGGYGGNEFDDWFRAKARDGRQAWIYRDELEEVAALCIFAVQKNEAVNDAGEVLRGDALKLCTFKVGEHVRGRKIGELFLKAAFKHATSIGCEHVFTHAQANEHEYLVRLLEEFGFSQRGTYKNDEVFVKAHPIASPVDRIEPDLFVRRYFPHFRSDENIAKYLVPIQPQYHDVLFPDFVSDSKRQLMLFDENRQDIGNAIKLAYLCHAQTNNMEPGDILLFYRTNDEKAITSIGIVDRFEVLEDAESIARLVSRRTVYSQHEIEELAGKPTKVILFRLVEHLPHAVSYGRLIQDGVVTGSIQSITKISHEKFSRVFAAAGR